MSARNCLLCGKALSRWSGTGEEFCTREHRNQYRLRRGMDRVAEAHQVASLMRRRENLKPVAATPAFAPSSLNRRGFFQPKTERAPQTGGVRTPSLKPFRPHLVWDNRFVEPEPKVAADDLEPRACPANARFPVRPATASLAASQSPVHVVAAGSVAEPGIAASGKPRRLSLTLPLRPWSRVQLPKSMSEAPQPVAGQIDPARSSRPLASANKGKALRVSRGVGFKTPNMAFPNATAPELMTAMLTWPDGPRALQKVAAMASKIRSSQMPIAMSSMSVPNSPVPAGVAFRWPGVHRLTANRPSPVKSGRHELNMAWVPSPAPSNTPFAGIVPAHILASSRLKHVRQPAANTAQGRHVATAPFGNSEEFIGKERQSR